MWRLEDHQRDLDLCLTCPKLCAYACPVSQATSRESTTPWGKMTLAHLLRLGHLPLTPENVEPLSYCLACRYCTSACRHGVEVGETLNAARIWAHERGVTGAPEARLREKMARDSSPWEGAPSPEVADLFREFGAPEAHAVFFPGCHALFSRPSEIVTAFRLFSRLKLDFIALADPSLPCCGLPLYRAGFREEFLRHGRALIDRFGPARLIVTPCAECAHALKVLYAESGLPLTARVLHLSEFLRTPLSSERNRFRRLESRVALHDACHLSRHLGLNAFVREMVQGLVETPLVPLVYEGESTYCCGESGALAWTRPEVSARIASERARQLRQSGAETVVCPSVGCATALDRALGTDLNVLTLTDLIGRVLGD